MCTMTRIQVKNEQIWSTIYVAANAGPDHSPNAPVLSSTGICQTSSAGMCWVCSEACFGEFWIYPFVKNHSKATRNSWKTGKPCQKSSEIHEISLENDESCGVSWCFYQFDHGFSIKKTHGKFIRTRLGRSEIPAPGPSPTAVAPLSPRCPPGGSVLNGPPIFLGVQKKGEKPCVKQKVSLFFQMGFIMIYILINYSNVSITQMHHPSCAIITKVKREKNELDHDLTRKISENLGCHLGETWSSRKTCKHRGYHQWTCWFHQLKWWFVARENRINPESGYKRDLGMKTRLLKLNLGFNHDSPFDHVWPLN